MKDRNLVRETVCPKAHPGSLVTPFFSTNCKLKIKSFNALYTVTEEMLTMSSLPCQTHVAHTWHNWSHRFFPESGWTLFLSVLKRKTTAPSYLWPSQDSWRMHEWWTIPEEVQRGWGKLRISLLTRATLWTQTPFLSFIGARHHHSNFQGPAKTEAIGNAQEVTKQTEGYDAS